METSTTTAAPAASSPSQPAQGSSQGADRALPGTSATQNASQQAGEGKTPAQAPKTYELKVNGKVQKFTEEELLSRASIAEAAQQRFSEAAQMRKQAEAALGKIRDPKQMVAALQDPALGLSRDQIREAFEEWYAREFIEPESLTPEQRKLRDAEQRLKKYEEQEKERQAEKEREQQDSLTAQAREELQKNIIEVLETSGLPKTNFTVRRIAYWMQRNQANGFDAPMAVVAGQVRNEINSSLRDLVESSDGEVLVKLLGDGVIQKLRKYDLEQLRKTRGQGNQPQASQSHEPPPDRHGRPPTQSDVTDRIRKMQRGEW